jgi:ADP-ribose pyrophosphatase YjhB (NUDIX family)
MPTAHHFTVDFLDFECSLVKRSRDKGRTHDVTCFIRQPDGRFVCIQKHQYANTGIYRAPSGGAKVGELIEDAAYREMKEETGLDIRLQRFVLDVTLDVVCKDETISWRSFVFLADPIGGKMEPIDTYEIYDVKIMDRAALLGPIGELMEKSGWGGFAYRLFLTRKFFECLDQLDI